MFRRRCLLSLVDITRRKVVIDNEGYGLRTTKARFLLRFPQHDEKS
jgi:hypothetical protein